VSLWSGLDIVVRCCRTLISDVVMIASAVFARILLVLHDSVRTSQDVYPISPIVGAGISPGWMSLTTCTSRTMHRRIAAVSVVPDFSFGIVSPIGSISSRCSSSTLSLGSAARASTALWPWLSYPLLALAWQSVRRRLWVRPDTIVESLCRLLSSGSHLTIALITADSSPTPSDLS